jgi:RpiR family transcriptional regulator, carbohydrate utilization regulator
MSKIQPKPSLAAQNIIEVVQQALPDLRKSERKVAERLLEDPQRILNATLAETSKFADVSEPTVIRFCVAIGCSGYQEFKLRLAHSLALGASPTQSALETEDSGPDLIEKIFGYTLSGLDWARTHLDPKAIGAAIDCLAHANSIEFFGLGASGIVALDAQQKFPLFGVPCGAPTDTHQQIMTATMMRLGDVAVVISNTGRTVAIIEVAQAASRAGAKVIAITGALSPLLDHCDIGIVVETIDNSNLYTPTISRIAALVVIDILSVAVGLARDAEHGKKFAEMKRLLRAQRQQPGSE